MDAYPIKVQTQETPLIKSGVSLSLCWSLASQQFYADGSPSCLFADLPGRFIPFEGRCAGGCSCRASAFSGLAEIFQRLYITGTYPIAFTVPFCTFFIFNELWISQCGSVLIMELLIPKIPENHRYSSLSLALGTIMCSPASQQNAPDRRLAAAARKAGAQVDAVFQLEEAAHTVGVHVIGD